MTGALMLIVYGNPLSAGAGQMTTSIRTAKEHHLPSTNLTWSANNHPELIPDVRVLKSHYDAPLNIVAPEGSANAGKSPSHLAVSHVVCYSCDTWPGALLHPQAQSQPLIWAANPKQVFYEDEYGDNVYLDRHDISRGWGYVYADLSTTASDRPEFPAIDRSAVTVNAGFSAMPVTDWKVKPGDGGSVTAIGSVPSPSSTSTSTANPGAGVEEPARTIRGKSLRDWMWHLHGLLMTLAFLVLLPAGIVFIRSGHPRAFNFHWTTQGFGIVSAGLGSAIGIMQSRKISLAHQFLGIAVVWSLVVQAGLGWKHNRDHVRGGGKGARSQLVTRAHVWLGRSVLGAGYLNIVLGLILRGYGTFTMLAVGVAVVLEVVFLVWFMARLKSMNVASGHQARDAPVPTGESAEEYFQLVGDEDEEDEMSDDGANAKEGESLRRDKTERAKRLAKLDAV